MKIRIGETLNQYRLKTGLSTKDVCIFLNANGLTCTEENVFKWESGKSLPDIDELLELCRLYGIKSPKEFLDK